MSEKCTPGEWSVKDYPIEERDGEMIRANINVVAPSRDSTYPHFSICVVDVSQEYPSFMPSNVEEAEANARLFAASKKMLEALREILLDMEIAQKNMRDAAKKDPRWDGCAEAIQPRVDAARAAIAAATGEQQ